MIYKRICKVLYCKAPFTVDLDKEPDYIYCPNCRLKENEEFIEDSYTFTNATKDLNDNRDDGRYLFNHNVSLAINRKF